MKDVELYYDNKTNKIIEKYGGNIRIHYHTGISDGKCENDDINQIRQKMYLAQEKVLDLLDTYYPRNKEKCKILDVGCGLGGAAIYWTMKRNADVTAITIVEKHKNIIEQELDKLNIKNKIRIIIEDAHRFIENEKYDMITAIESSCYLDRNLWIENVSKLLKRNGILQIFDWMINENVNKNNEINDIEKHWKTKMGTEREYCEVAKKNKLILKHKECLNEKTIGFWTLAKVWNDKKSEENNISGNEKKRLIKSSKEILQLQKCFINRTILSNHLIFEKI